jgi:hypothetical protein
MATNWMEKERNKEARRNLFPIIRHQVFPMTVQATADSCNSGDKQIYLASLNSPHAPRIYIGKFGQSLLSHPQGRANTPDVTTEFAKIGSSFSFGHPLLRERFEIDLKGVIRPNLKM